VTTHRTFISHSARLPAKHLHFARTLLALFLLGSLSSTAFAQGGASLAPAPPEQCSFHEFFHDTWAEGSQSVRGLKAIPGGAIRPRNLKWELPILAATGILIAEADQPADKRIQSASLQRSADVGSNVGLGLEIGSGAISYGVGCGEHRGYLRDTGFKALFAMGAAGVEDLALKLAFDRQYPAPASTGEFWGGGRSFPSGHSATSFAFAAVVAHRYPHNRWIKWSAYALATGVSLSRYPAKKHYLSDILVGATVGYVTGSYLAER
jgi:hypothetical protein